MFLGADPPSLSNPPQPSGGLCSQERGGQCGLWVGPPGPQFPHLQFPAFKAANRGPLVSASGSTRVLTALDPGVDTPVSLPATPSSYVGPTGRAAASARLFAFSQGHGQLLTAVPGPARSPHPPGPRDKAGAHSHTSAHSEPEPKPGPSRTQTVVTRAPRQTPRSRAPRKSLQQGSLSRGTGKQARLTAVLCGLPLLPCLTDTRLQTRHLAGCLGCRSPQRCSHFQPFSETGP